MKAFTRSSMRGFTLIEILVGFCLLFLIIGVGAYSLSAQSAKKKIVEPANELQSLARRGMQMAITNRRPFVLAISENSVALQESRIRSGSIGSIFDDGPEKGVIDSFELPEFMKFLVRSWEDKYFRPPEEVRDDDEEVYRWVFESSGICEPLGIKLICEEEGSEGMLTMEFNPLTAQIQEPLNKTIVLGAENIDELE
ncbi:MAG: hypothetical protein EVB09_12450 [Verrucomicrobiaceae bacterium]|nr:MAG: hypothetical protein EVB09_12450 [Verrucomicrobiaceae bacterium]